MVPYETELRRNSREMRRLKVQETLGEGEFGRVDLVEDSSGERFALKKIDKSHPKYHKHTAQNETNALYTLDHEVIVDIIDEWETESEVCILLEYVEGLDLVTILEEGDYNPIEEDIAVHLFHQLAEGIQHCHSKGIAHRDIKLDNVMINQEGNVKLIDFGLSTMKHPEKRRDDVGSLEYCAPEICRKEEYNAFQSDIWSAGVLLYALLHGEFPFSATDIKSFQEGATSARTPSFRTSRKATNLIQRMLSFDPKDRPTIEEVLCHPWFRSEMSESSES
eukprot:TRINITY_DN4293_c0_g1_i1.p1 TRINITY_DN4293_c0_g1~~TRINITY_DN4293_c0_g1_i1.p1  ORF type:complete len:278 (-),score=69.23 TRINITY_DN4293_c0_g1_i1:121-954(-)